MRLIQKKKTAYILLPIIMAISISSCGNQEPDDNTGESYFPLAAGNVWEYESLEIPGKYLRKELEGPEPIPDDPEGRSAYVLVRTELDDPDDVRRTYIDEVDGILVRYRKEWWEADVIKTVKVYDPFFLRIDPDKMSAGDHFTASFSRTDYDETGTVTETDTKEYSYEVEAVNEEITIENGETLSCVKVSRLDTTDGDTKDLWYAPGVGKVKEEGVESATGDEERELLIDYTVQ